jgi:uncharacterized protein (TIGR00369 family)
MTDAKTKIAQQFMQALPHARALGMRLVSMGDGQAEIEMDYDPRFVGDPETGVIHGGAVSALMDTCCGAAAMSHPASPGGTATIDLRIDYMRPATPVLNLCRWSSSGGMRRSRLWLQVCPILGFSECSSIAGGMS